MATIRKSLKKDGSASYHAVVRVAGYPDKAGTFTTRRAAMAWASGIESDRRMMRTHPEGVAEKYTVAEMIDRYLVETEAANADRPRHVEWKRSRLNWWKRFAGDMRLSKFSPSVIAEAKHELVKGRRSSSTVNRYTAAMSHCVTMAVKEWGWMHSNPFAIVAKMREPRGRVRFLSEAEREALLTACAKETRKPLHLIVVLAISTGARKMEILGIRWADVDFKRGMVTLHHTKNDERRTMFIAGLAAQLLQQHYEQRVRRWQYVFASRHCDKPMDIDREFRRAARIAKLDNFRFHDLRHTCASYLAANGASTNEIAEVLGHKTLNMVKRYAHLTVGHTRDVVASMNTSVFGEGGSGCNAQ